MLGNVGNVFWWTDRPNICISHSPLLLLQLLSPSDISQKFLLIHEESLIEFESCNELWEILLLRVVLFLFWKSPHHIRKPSENHAKSPSRPFNSSVFKWSLCNIFYKRLFRNWLLLPTCPSSMFSWAWLKAFCACDLEVEKKEKVSLIYSKENFLIAS